MVTISIFRTLVQFIVTNLSRFKKWEAVEKSKKLLWLHFTREKTTKKTKKNFI